VFIGYFVRFFTVLVMVVGFGCGDRSYEGPIYPPPSYGGGYSGHNNDTFILLDDICYNYVSGPVYGNGYGYGMGYGSGYVYGYGYFQGYGHYTDYSPFCKVWR